MMMMMMMLTVGLLFSFKYVVMFAEAFVVACQTACQCLMLLVVARHLEVNQSCKKTFSEFPNVSLGIILRVSD